MKNVIKTILTDDERAELVDLLSQIENLLDGKLASLTTAERRRFGSIKEKNKLLVDRVRDYRRGSPSKSSPDIDWDEFEADYQARAFFENYIRRLKSIAYRMEGSKILHDYDNYNDSRKEYTYTQYMRGFDDAGYSQKADTLKQLFNRSGTGLKNKHKNKEQND